MSKLLKPVGAATARRLSPHISNWQALQSALTNFDFPESDLNNMISLELQGERRRGILDRLVGHLSKAKRKAMWGEIESLGGLTGAAVGRKTRLKGEEAP